MARRPWHQSIKRLRDSRFCRLTPAARAVLLTLQELFDDEPELCGNVSMFANWMVMDRKVTREALEAIKDCGILSVTTEDRGKEGTFFTVSDPKRPPTVTRPSPDRAPTVTQPSPDRDPDKSANDAGSGLCITPIREEKRREEIPPTPQGGKTAPKPSGKGTTDLPPRFEEFWAAYPLHEGRAPAIKSWLKLKPDDDLIDQMLAAIDQAREHSRKWRDGYIPLPSTWLNQRRWEDEIQAGTGTTGESSIFDLDQYGVSAS